MKFKDFVYERIEGTNSYAFFREYLDLFPDFSEESITFDFLETLKKDALERYANNTIIVYFTTLKQILYRAIHSGYKLPLIYEDIQKTLVVQPQASEHVYLSVEELKLLEMFEPKTKTEDFTKNVFLLCAYTGCRLSDYPLINSSAIEGKELFYASHKTQRTARLELHPLVPELIENLKKYQYSADSAKAIVARISKSILKQIGDNLEVGNPLTRPLTLFQRGRRSTLPKYEFVSSHTARRSFATNLYLDGFDIKNISRMMGHSDTRQTEGYIVVSHSDVRTNTRSYLSGQSNELTESVEESTLNMTLAGLGLCDSDIAKMTDLIYQLQENKDKMDGS